MIRKIQLGPRLVILLLLGATTLAAQAPRQSIVNPISKVEFEQDADVKCLRSAVEKGDPNTGPSTLILKAPPNCVVPWHYHTAEEQLIVVHGNVLTEMEGISPIALGQGGFAMMPSKEKHQFSCKSKSACILFVTFDRALDIYWVKESQPSRRPGK